MSTSVRAPLVGVSACMRMLDEHPFHAAGEKYLTAVVDGARAQPLIIPALGDSLDLADLLGCLDGVMLTGSPSNVEPHHFRGPPGRRETLHDPKRDSTVLPLILSTVDAGVPLLAICRGMQELNVAFGGTLHQHLHEVPGRLDHRSDTEVPFAERYEPSHRVQLAPGGALARLLGTLELEVNSLHQQGIERLGRGLVVEATAPDGTVEAVRVADAPAFALGVQWHPEWRVLENPAYAAIFAAFGEAARRRASGREHPAVSGKVA